MARSTSLSSRSLCWSKNRSRTAVSLLEVSSGRSSYFLGTVVFFLASDYRLFLFSETFASKQAFFLRSSVSSLVHQGTLGFFAAWLPGLDNWKVISQATVSAEVNFSITLSVSGCSLIFCLILLSLAVQSVMSSGESKFSFKFFDKLCVKVPLFQLSHCSVSQCVVLSICHLPVN